MMLDLYLLRHAKTNQLSPTGKDFDRELLPKGIHQAQKIAPWLADYIEEPLTVFVSTAQRTQQTYSLVKDAVVSQEIIFDEDLYLAEQSYYLEKIAQQPGDAPLLFIGHNFGISDLASYCSGDTIHLQTCGFAHLQFDLDTWAAIGKSSAILKRYHRPKV